MISIPNFANVVLRGLTLGGRFLFTFMLAKSISAESLGLYGLFAASIGYFLYFVGLDFYTFTTREATRRTRDDWGWMLKSHAALCCILYIIILPLIVGFFLIGALPSWMFLWFAAILILEHANQEFSRFFVAISEQLTSSYVFFIRQASWAIVAAVIMALFPAARTLSLVFALWTLSGLVAVLISAQRLRKIAIRGWARPVNWSWVQTGVKVCIPFLLATLALRGAQTVDKYWLQYLVDRRTVGLYVLCTGIANTLLSFLDAGVFSFAYPVLLRCAHNGEWKEFESQLRKMLAATVIICAVFSLISLAILPYLFHWIGNEFYVENRAMYVWVLAATVINALGLVPHYALYSCGEDRPIITSHVVSLVVFVTVTWLASMIVVSATAVLFGITVVFSVILVWKSCSLYQANCRRA
jgi:O-antigen/teichoic acid export membrane protein